jgi:dienelactone hydrolase
MHKDAPFVTRMASHLAGTLGFAAVAIDAPLHGERTPIGEKGLSALERRERMGLAAWRDRNSQATAQAVADWQAAIDAVQSLDTVPDDGPIGYFGVSMGTRFGIPLAAAEPRITAAVFGLFGHPAGDGDAAFARVARQVTIPVLFLLQWDDELFPRNDGLALFDMLGSQLKTLHVTASRHATSQRIQNCPRSRLERKDRIRDQPCLGPQHLLPRAPPAGTARAVRAGA